VHVVADARYSGCGIFIWGLLQIAKVHASGLGGFFEAVMVFKADFRFQDVGETGEDGRGDAVRVVQITTEEGEIFASETCGHAVDLVDEVVAGHLVSSSVSFKLEVNVPFYA
jgi:hypothetical protein